MNHNSGSQPDWGQESLREYSICQPKSLIPQQEGEVGVWWLVFPWHCAWRIGMP
jgi:hypothetical protein